MDIIFISEYLPTPKYADGATVRVNSLLDEFEKIGSNVEYIYTGLTFPSENSLAWLNKRGIKVKHIPIKGIKKLLYYCFNIPFKLKLDYQNIQLSSRVFIEGISSACVVENFCQKYSVILSLVDSLSLANKKIYQSRGISIHKRVKYMMKYLMYLKLEKALRKKSVKFYFVSSEDAYYFETLTNRHSYVLPNGVDNNEFYCISHAQDSFNKIRAVYTGNLSGPMNESAARELINVYNSNALVEYMEMTIIGRYASSSLRELLSKSRVNFLDNVEDMSRSLDDFNVFLCPIHYGTGIKNNVLQAMSKGLLCVVTDLIAKPIGLTNGVNAIILQDFTELENTLKKFSPRQLNHIAKAGREKILKDFSWDAIALKYFNKGIN